MIGILQEEVAKLADVMSTADSGVTHLPAAKRDAIARVLAAAGFEQAAAGPIIANGGPDEHGDDGGTDQDDLHHHMSGPEHTIRKQEVSPVLRRRAQDYLRAHVRTAVCSVVASEGGRCGRGPPRCFRSVKSCRRRRGTR